MKDSRDGRKQKEKKQRELRHAAPHSRRPHPGVDDPGIQCVNWKRVKRMNLIALAPEESERDTGAVEEKP